MSDTEGSKAIGDNLADAKTAGEALHGIGDKAVHAGADAVNQAKDLAGEAKEKASSLLAAAQDKANTVADEQKTNVAEYLDDVAKAVHRSGEQLEGHQDWVAHLVERGADELGSLADTLRTNDLQSLLASLGSLARREPALFVGASMAAGFVMARVGRVAASATPAPSKMPSAPPSMASAPSATPPAPPSTGSIAHKAEQAVFPMQQAIGEARGERQ